jgi:hypothetical protein
MVYVFDCVCVCAYVCVGVCVCVPLTPLSSRSLSILRASARLLAKTYALSTMAAQGGARFQWRSRCAAAQPWMRFGGDLT